MFILENVKRTAEKLTGVRCPSLETLKDLVVRRKPGAYRLKDDGITPNNPRLPLVHYRSAVRLPDSFDPAAIFEQLFAANGWERSWRNGIYDFLHYHSKTHEVLGIARGHARVEFGGKRGRRLSIKAGDVIVLPAGIGHRRLSSSRDLLVVGAYPPHGEYDEQRSSKREHDAALATVPKVRLPAKDPVYGRDGPLFRVWRRGG